MILEFSTLFPNDDEFVKAPHLLELPDRNGNTPLFTCVKVNSTKTLKLLISYNINFLHQKKNGNTVLHECAQYNATECLIILSSYCGADLFQVINKEGQRAIDIAHRKKHTDCIVALQKLE